MATASDKDREHGFEEAVWQFLDGYLRGTAPDIEELVREYPEYEDKIRQKISEFRKVDSLFDSLGRTDESDFEGAGPEPDLVGQKIGSFEIVEMIGRGGMGVVYLARDTKLKRSVAIKSIPAELQANSRARTRFRREAELLASLNHPNIAGIHEIIEEEESGYLILEYVPGQTLAERIAHGLVELQQALLIGQQIAGAISAAHKKGIVHRDLKPGNIKVTPDGQIKVLDFGLAKVAVSEGGDGDITVTGPGRVIGTPAYMSPEQARGQSADHRTDIWSLGCIMFQMLTGHLPFEGETATDTLAHIIEREPDWQELPQNTPANIRVLLRRCLEKDPRKRLQHIADAVLEIRETLNLPVTAPPMTTAVKPRKMTATITAIAIVILSGIAVWFGLIRQAQPSTGAIRLMVLPFENKGSAEDDYFVDSITHAIIGRLLDISSLGVISAMQYNNNEQSAKQMVEELHVDYILLGTVRRERPLDPDSRVRITPQLIKTSDDTLVWTKPYETEETIKLQSDIANQVAQELEIILPEREQQALAYVPTKNMEAYDFYLQGENYFRRGYNPNDLEKAIEMYDKAVKLDPAFAVAYCRLSMCHSWMYWFDHDGTQRRLDMAKEAADIALGYDPDLSEAHQALGRYYYLGYRDYDRALKELYTALESQPRNSDILSFIGFIQRRQGKFQEALETIKKASELQPLSSILVQEVASTLIDLGRYAEAEQHYNRAIFLAPDVPRTYWNKARLYVYWHGRTDKAREVVNQALQKIGKKTNLFTILLAQFDVYDGNYQVALDRLSSDPIDFSGAAAFTPYMLRCAHIYRYMGKNEKARECYEKAKDIIETAIEEDPNDALVRSSLGIAYAGLGCNDEAIREGKLAVELLPVTRDVSIGGGRIKALARIYVMIGRYDEAIDQLDFLLSIPGQLSKPLLRIDPAWDPLRDHPRFKKLIETGK